MTMQNPMLQMMNLNQGIRRVKGLYDTVRMAQNPQMALQKMLQSNPNVKQAMDLINQGGGDPQTVFYNLARQQGVDPNQILNMLK